MQDTEHLSTAERVALQRDGVDHLARAHELLAEAELRYAVMNREGSLPVLAPAFLAVAHLMAWMSAETDSPRSDPDRPTGVPVGPTDADLLGSSVGGPGRLARAAGSPPPGDGAP